MATSSARPADLAGPLAVLECPASGCTFIIVPLFRMALAHAPDMALLVGKGRIAERTEQGRRRLRRRRRVAPLICPAQGGPSPARAAAGLRHLASEDRTRQRRYPRMVCR